jgi:uncharacterized protein (DUF2141 family)
MTSPSKNLMSGLMLVVAGALLAVGTHSLPAQMPAKCALTVKVTGIHNTEGDVKITVRSGPDTVVQSRAVEIDAKTMTATAVFDNLAPGTYGVTVLHDENKNGKLDFGEMGMPVEGYGHSNNPAKRMGPPSFDETKFTLSEPTTSLEIQLIYWP